MYPFLSEVTQERSLYQTKNKLPKSIVSGGFLDANRPQGFRSDLAVLTFPTFGQLGGTEVAQMHCNPRRNWGPSSIAVQEVARKFLKQTNSIRV